MNTGVQLPVSALRLLVSPIQLVSAAIWQTIQNRVVADYGLLEDFVSMVTDIVPDLLTNSQRTQLILGLQVRLILELCQFKKTANLKTMQQHLDRLNILIKAFATDEDDEPCLDFVDFVKHLLNSPAQREHFFLNVFPKEFGPSYDKALNSLMEMFLSRLEAFLPWKTFQQVTSSCDEVSSALVNSMESMRHSEELKTLLHHHRDHIHLGPKDDSLNGACILSALKRVVVKEHGLQAGDCVQGENLDQPLQSKSVRPNRGLKMQMILLEEKKGLNNEESVTSPSDHSDNEDLSDGCNNSSWSFYSDENSCGAPHSWSEYSSDHSLDAPASSSPPSRIEEVASVPNKNKGLENTSNKEELCQKKPPQKSSRHVWCFICNEQVDTNLKTHLRTHFPDGQYACPRCGSRYKLFTSLKLHLKRTCYDHAGQQAGPASGPDLYKCEKCEEAFKYKLSLEAHQRTHHELYCSVCRKVLKDAAMLERHKSSHIGFQCTRCEETFTLFKPLLRHAENFHKISRPFKCNHCSKTFPGLRFLIKHEWKHTGHLPFRCAFCGLRFRNDADLVSHQRVHTREKPYLCAECGKTFSQRSNLLRHLHFIHSESKNEKKHICTECNASFKEKGALTLHQKRKHHKQRFRHTCSYCGKSFSASSIKRHTLIHTGERPFKCDVPECDKAFLSAVEVKKHVLTFHSSERPFKCEICQKGFITLGLLNSHAKIHSGKKPFVCNICLKAFPKSYSMNRHKKLVHSLSS
ncbi:zinc finger protein 85-like isoform X3 [Entelurus aequoreus]|uniref:zinc finger protein 85-like isoform X3 n=1 Tax=Entelurus aequoreus TaxID=161455 RepID=UPI002B1DE90A|nr:zinc finger protein 85-like isoform X3 [Entelurus aequoreus]